MPRSILHDHADLIIDMVGDGATNEEIRDALLAKPVPTSIEAVRVWVKKNAPPWMLEDRGPGRRKNPKPVRLRFLPEANAEVTVPPLLEATVQLLTGAGPNVRERSIFAESILQTAGIQVDTSIPPSQWRLAGKMLADISDLELVLLTYALSDHHSPPSNRQTHALRTWLTGLVRDSAAVKAKIIEGADFSVSEIR